MLIKIIITLDFQASLQVFYSNLLQKYYKYFQSKYTI
jgi:hypothetical protein